MGFADVWNKTLVYFGIAEEEDWDEDAYVTDEDLQRSYADGRTSAGWRHAGASGSSTTGPTRSRRAATTGPLCCGPRVAAVPSPAPRCASTSSCRGASTTRSRLLTSSRKAIPVILNLQSSDQDLSKRLIDFASGLTYALDGGMQRVADKVFLLTPRNVEVSAEERARLLERGGFFNQA